MIYTLSHHHTLTYKYIPYSFTFNISHAFICVRMCVYMPVCPPFCALLVHATAHVGVSSHFPPCGSWGSNSCQQGRWQAALPTEASYQTLFCNSLFLIVRKYTWPNFLWDPPASSAVHTLSPPKVPHTWWGVQPPQVHFHSSCHLA